MSTMRDVALRAGVSTKTVSRVFNDDRHVTDETRERVQAAMLELQYVPNLMARGLRVGKDKALGIGVPDVSDPFFAAIIRSIELTAAQRGIAVVVTSLGTDPALERVNVEALLRRQIVGLFVVPTSPDQSYMRSWPGETPVVFIDRTPAGFRADSFVEDDQAAARLATEHLLKHGHTRVGFIGDSDEIPTTRNRLKGYREALSAAGHDLDNDLVLLGWGAGRPDAELLPQVTGPGAPTALFSSNARSTIQLLTALDVSQRHRTAIVSFGDLDLAAAVEPALSVVDQDPHRLGAMAAERMFAKIDHPEKKFRRKTVYPTHLIERGSGELPPPTT